MSDETMGSNGRTGRLICLILGIVIFGVLMGVRDDLEFRWQRSVAAACAFIVLGSCVLRFREARK